MREELYDLIREAAVSAHDQRWAIIVRLCRALKNGDLSFQEIRRLLLSYELSSEEVGVMVQFLSDDMVISKQFRFNPENNKFVYTVIIQSLIEYRHFDKQSHVYLKQAFDKLMIITPPQPEIVVYLSNLLGSCSRKSRTVEEENENREMQQAIEAHLEKI